MSNAFYAASVWCLLHWVVAVIINSVNVRAEICKEHQTWQLPSTCCQMNCRHTIIVRLIWIAPDDKRRNKVNSRTWNISIEAFALKSLIQRDIANSSPGGGGWSTTYNGTRCAIAWVPCLQAEHKFYGVIFRSITLRRILGRLSRKKLFRVSTLEFLSQF